MNAYIPVDDVYYVVFLLVFVYFFQMIFIKLKQTKKVCMMMVSTYYLAIASIDVAICCFCYCFEFS